MFRSSNSESSLLLWVVAAVVALLAAYLFVGWLRRTQGQCGRQVLGPVLLAERYGADNGRIARIIMSSTVLAFVSFMVIAWLLGVDPKA